MGKGGTIWSWLKKILAEKESRITAAYWRVFFVCKFRARQIIIGKKTTPTRWRKNMKIFIDANIIIDVLLKREDFYEDSANVLSICEKHKSALAPHTISNIFFITRKDYTAKERKSLLLDILRYIDIVPTGKYQIVQALKNDDIDDFEDALQLECAREFNADFIVSRNVDDFVNSDIKVITPQEFVKRFG